MSKLAVLYSGGTDSTLTSALLAQEYDEIHLLTYVHHGIFNKENISSNVDKLKEKYSQVRFIHKYFEINHLMKKLSYESYLRNFWRHRYFLLSTCGFCKLSMHGRTIEYCLREGIQDVADGANKGMDIYPAQMSGVLGMIRNLYREFGLNLFNPVFDYEVSEKKQMVDPYYMKILGIDDEDRPVDRRTTEDKLYEMGLANSREIKGSADDRKQQGRCFQLFLFRIFAKELFLSKKKMEEYVDRTERLFDEKISFLKAMLKNRKKHAKSFKH